MLASFESGEGGGVLAIVIREEHLDKAGALAWLEQQGVLSGRGRIGAHCSDSGKTVSSESPYSPANQGSATITPEQRTKETLPWIRQQILPIADTYDNPIRAWMHWRNFWFLSHLIMRDLHLSDLDNLSGMDIFCNSCNAKIESPYSTCMHDFQKQRYNCYKSGIQLRKAIEKRRHRGCGSPAGDAFDGELNALN